MQTVTFIREYKHKIDDLRVATYPPIDIEVSNEVAEAARKAGALKEDSDGGRPVEGNGTGSANQPAKRRSAAVDPAKNFD